MSPIEVAIPVSIAMSGQNIIKGSKNRHLIFVAIKNSTSQNIPKQNWNEPDDGEYDECDNGKKSDFVSSL